jgi:hypothetical protein
MKVFTANYLTGLNYISELLEEFEDTKGVIRIRKLKDRQHINDLQYIHIFLAHLAQSPHL